MKKLILILIFSTVSFSAIVGYWSANKANADTLFDMKGANNSIAGGATKPTVNSAQHNVLFSHGTGGGSYGNYDRFVMQTCPTYTTDSTFSILYYAKSSGNTAYGHSVFHTMNTSNYHIQNYFNDTSMVADYTPSTTNERWDKKQLKANKWNLGVLIYSPSYRQPYTNTSVMSVQTGRSLSGNFYRSGSQFVLGAGYGGSVNKYYYGNVGLSLQNFIQFNHALRPAEISNYSQKFRGTLQ